jgi:hypothetical protein
MVFGSWALTITLAIERLVFAFTAHNWLRWAGLRLRKS